MSHAARTFPWPPGQEPKDDPRVIPIADASRELVTLRDIWLNPPGATDADLKTRTLTSLYNQRPTLLAQAHQRLDHAVLGAYAWPHDLPDDHILERLLAPSDEQRRPRDRERGRRRLQARAGQRTRLL